MQVEPQSRPVGLLPTVPVPLPALFTASVCMTTVFAVNVALTVSSLPAGVSWQVKALVAMQLPPEKPAKTEPAAGVAVSVTGAPWLNGCAHVEPQSMPGGLLLTLPEPVPASVTLIRSGGGENVAVTAWSLLMVTLQVDVPEQPPPDQPANTEPALGVAERVTVDPSSKPWEQAAPQSMPAGRLLTLPEPDPESVTVNVCCGGAG